MNYHCCTGNGPGCGAALHLEHARAAVHLRMLFFGPGQARIGWRPQRIDKAGRRKKLFIIQK
jgi:hypothetical protein